MDWQDFAESGRQAQENEGSSKRRVGASPSRSPPRHQTPPPRSLKPRYGKWTNNLQTPDDDIVRFETPTSVYTWPRLRPASQMGEGPMIITRYDLSAYTTYPFSEKSLDARSWEKKPCIEAHVPEAITSTSMHESPLHSPELPRSSHPQIFVPPQVDDHTSGISSPTTTDSSSNGPQIDAEPPISHTATSSRSTSLTLKGNDGQKKAVESCVDNGSDSIAWELHMKSTISMTGEVLYVCEYGGKCGYSSTKQSVKRHVLGTHLKFKPHECPYCNKHFPARAALSSHIATHTGELPLACKYRGCDKRYSDPARRHRHHINAHGYEPKKYKKKFRPPTDVD